MEKNLQQMPQQAKFPRIVKMPQSYKIVLPIDFENKVRLLCSKVSSVEWSGILFYTYSGSFEDGSLTIVAKDICLMDIGNTTYTSFDMSPEVISFMVDNELMDCQMGLIHSHNNMSTFFSTTDVGTLEEEGTDRNHFVSLIVNNEGTYSAAITRKLHIERNINECYSYDSFNDEVITGNRTLGTSGESFEYYTLTIEKEDANTYLTNKIKEIKEYKAKLLADNKKAAPKVEEKEVTIKINNTQAPKQFELDMQDEIESLEALADVHFPAEYIHEYAVQIIAGSVIVKSSSIDIKKWIDSMPTLYNKRFNNNLGIYKIWISTFIEFLLTNIQCDDFECNDIPEDLKSSILASDLIDYLSEFKINNAYYDVIIDELTLYIIF